MLSRGFLILAILLGGASKAWAQACSALNGTSAPIQTTSKFVLSMPVEFATGDTVTVTISGATGGSGLITFGEGETSWSGPGTYTVSAQYGPDVAPVVIRFSVAPGVAGTATFSCGGHGESLGMAEGQSDAQVALQSMRTTTSFVQYLLMKNVTQALRSSEPAAAPHNSSAEAQTSLTDESTAPQSSMSGPGASMQALMPDRWLRQPQQMELWTSLGQNNSPARPTSFSITKDDLIQWAQKPDGSNRIRDLLGSKWNVWAEGRVTGTTDTVAATNSLGFNGNIGADYRFFPWMIAGLSLGVESFSTNLWSAGSQINATGVSAVPYVGFRLDPNLFASAYVGITGLSYNSIPELGVSAAFGATRLFAGANLSGYWQDGPWRFEPAISIVYGSEWQTAFTDSANNAVPGETIEFGRVSAGPEIGYTFRDSEGTWQLEPYFRTQINLDFATNENTFLNGLLVNTRSTVSGTLAGGIFYRSAGNFSVRGEGSYESLGVAGLDAWSVIINLNFAF